MNDYGTEERRNKIVEIVNKQGKVRVNQLSKIFSISEVTIRNDLARLESMECSNVFTVALLVHTGHITECQLQIE